MDRQTEKLEYIAYWKISFTTYTWIRSKKQTQQSAAIQSKCQERHTKKVKPHGTRKRKRDRGEGVRANTCGVLLPKHTRTPIVETQRTTGNSQTKRVRSRAACAVTRLHVSRCRYLHVRCACHIGHHFSIHGGFVYPLSTTSTALALLSCGLPRLLMYRYTLDKDAVQCRGTAFLRTHPYRHLACA